MIIRREHQGAGKGKGKGEAKGKGKGKAEGAHDKGTRAKAHPR